jgi:transcriptional regulator with XRE-family HTH domain
MHQRIKLAREEAGLSQKEVAEKINVDTSQYSKIERGLIKPTIEQIMRLCPTLNITYRWLIEGVGAKNFNKLNDYLSSRVIEKYGKPLEEFDKFDRRIIQQEINAEISMLTEGHDSVINENKEILKCIEEEKEKTRMELENERRELIETISNLREEIIKLQKEIINNLKND